jgi:plasmid stabilization system protein ParE
MMQLPLQSILFWIAVTLAPQDTSQILIKGPDDAWAWTKQSSGWSESADRAIWVAKGNTVTSSIKEEKKTEDVGQYVEGVKTHDWKESSDLKLKPNALLTLEEVTYVYTVDQGTPTEKQYTIRFRRATPAGKGAARLGYVGEVSDVKRSIAGSGHAIAFDRPEDSKYVSAVEIYASRYGYPQPPKEDFHVYLLDKDRKVIHDSHFPYAKIPRGPMRWYKLELPSIEVPEHFYVALSFNPQQTKGIYLGMDKTGKDSHSYVGLPDNGFELLEDRADWMIRVHLTAAKAAGKGR